MTRTLDKQEARSEREYSKLIKIKIDLEKALLDFNSWKHKIWKEYEEKSVAGISTSESDDYSGFGNYYYKFHEGGGSHQARSYPYYPTKALDPLEPAKMRKGTKLTFEDRIRTFKEVVASYRAKGKLSKIPLILTPEGYIYATKTSPAMKRNMLVLELTFDTDGRLYSPKTFNEAWEWQSKAIWQRSIGMPPSKIGKSLNIPLNTVKAMFLRLKISAFFGRYSDIDWSTTGYGRYQGETPSGWRVVLQGGSSGMLYPTAQGDSYEARETLGEMTGAHREGLLETEHVTLDRLQKNIKRFNFEKHQKEVLKREKTSKKRKKQVIMEQKATETETLEKNILNGFDLETGKYKENKDV